MFYLQRGRLPHNLKVIFTLSQDSPGSISLIIYLDFKVEEKKKTNQPLWQHFFHSK